MEIKSLHKNRDGSQEPPHMHFEYRTLEGLWLDMPNTPHRAPFKEDKPE